MNEPTKKPEQLDARTRLFRQQSAENQQNFTRNERQRIDFDKFFETCSDDDLIGLKAEVLPCLPDSMRLKLGVVNVRESHLLRRLIYSHVQKIGQQAKG